MPRSRGERRLSVAPVAGIGVGARGDEGAVAKG